MSMGNYLLVLRVGDSQKPPTLITRTSGRAAIRTALDILKDALGSGPTCGTAATLVGEGRSLADVRWLGSWLWSEADGLSWHQDDD